MNKSMCHIPLRNVPLNLDIPPVCTSAPAHGSAFCNKHCEAASELGYQTSLRGFLKDCNVTGKITLGTSIVHFLTAILLIHRRR